MTGELRPGQFIKCSRGTIVFTVEVIEYSDENNANVVGIIVESNSTDYHYVGRRDFWYKPEFKLCSPPVTPIDKLIKALNKLEAMQKDTCKMVRAFRNKNNGTKI